MKLTENIVFLRLAFTLPGQTRKVDGSATAEQQRIAASRMSASAKLYTGKAFAAIKTADAEAKIRLSLLAIKTPSTFRSTYILPRRLLAKADELLAAARERRNDLAIDFLASDYDAERERAREELGQAFSDELYPDSQQTLAKFSMAWNIFAMDVPQDLPQEVRERETKKLQEQISQVADDCRNALRSGLSDLVTHLAESLKPGADGERKKKVYASTVENLRLFLDTLSDRDITGDAEIKALGERAKEILGTVGVDDLRTNAQVAEKIRAGMVEIQTEVSKLFRMDGERKLDLDWDG